MRGRLGRLGAGGGFLVRLFLGLGGVVGALFRGAAVAEHQQHVAATVHLRGRHRAHHGEWLAGIVDHFLDRGHRIAGGEALPQAGADQ
ncbi:hypothetical protein T222_25145 [Pseudomonas aeruginosa LES400]|nr:hypothetical protein T222_25145 [Pseudomonas aeruginosa LES400]